jgi:hypothetical protein
LYDLFSYNAVYINFLSYIMKLYMKVFRWKMKKIQRTFIACCENNEIIKRLVESFSNLAAAGSDVSERNARRGAS